MDTLTSVERSARMALIKGKGTAPEKRVAKAFRAAAIRFRRQAMLPGRPDFLLVALRAVVFVHGCFWHRHPGCPRARIPKSRVAFWTTKLSGNVSRDRRNAAELRHRGYSVHVIWECQTESPIKLARRIRAIVSRGLARRVGQVHLPRDGR